MQHQGFISSVDELKGAIYSETFSSHTHVVRRGIRHDKEIVRSLQDMGVLDL